MPTFQRVPSNIFVLLCNRCAWDVSGIHPDKNVKIWLNKCFHPRLPWLFDKFWCFLVTAWRQHMATWINLCMCVCVCVCASACVHVRGGWGRLRRRKAVSFALWVLFHLVTWAERVLHAFLVPMPIFFSVFFFSFRERASFAWSKTNWSVSVSVWPAHQYKRWNH